LATEAVNLAGPKRGFTMIELVVVIGLISLLAAMLLPALQAAHQASRATQCLNNLRQLGIGLHSYRDAHSCFPSVVWVIMLLLPIEQSNLRQEFNQSLPVGASITVRNGIDTFPNIGPPNNQAPQGDKLVSRSALVAKYGLKKLSAMGMPCQQDTPAANSRATSRSLHPQGVHVFLLDGSAQFVSENIDPQIWQCLHSKDNSQPFELPFCDCRTGD
jgi:prepilin-type N-terminal cleavage/methylation domain-containing protein